MSETERYNVTLPDEEYVYYDTLLDRTITVTEVDEEGRFITHQEDVGTSDVTVEEFDKFFAWLAAERYAYIGQRNEEGIEVSKQNITNTFRNVYEIYSDDSVATIAESVMSDRTGENISAM